tara:strand:- start:165 stop:311 length:147 start_codon:yes stop_codon:yes gene_type:complete
MASFDATSSAVPDSLLLARQADRLARQATNTVMQDTIVGRRSATAATR